MSEFQSTIDTLKDSSAAHIVILAAGTLLLAGCAAPSSSEVSASTVPTPVTAEANGFEPSITYSPNGTRSIVMRDPVNHHSVGPTVYEFCDNYDLVAIGGGYGNGITGTEERSVKHPACLDHRLELQDFQLTK